MVRAPSSEVVSSNFLIEITVRLGIAETILFANRLRPGKPLIWRNGKPRCRRSFRELQIESSTSSPLEYCSREQTQRPEIWSNSSTSLLFTDHGLVGELLELILYRPHRQHLDHEDADHILFRIDPKCGAGGASPVVFAFRGDGGGLVDAEIDGKRQAE